MLKDLQDFSTREDLREVKNSRMILRILVSWQCLSKWERLEDDMENNGHVLSLAYLENLLDIRVAMSKLRVKI